MSGKHRTAQEAKRRDGDRWDKVTGMEARLSTVLQGKAQLQKVRASSVELDVWVRKRTQYAPVGTTHLKLGGNCIQV